VKTALKFGLVLLLALALTALPGGGSGLTALLTILLIAFFVAIALLAYRLYREHRFTLDSLEPRSRLILYGSIGLAFLTFTATARMWNAGGLGLLAWFGLLALCSYGVYWVLMRARSYE
jgi:hypothetical protein